jgi:hypothetical protein
MSMDVTTDRLPAREDPGAFQALRDVVLRPDAFFASLPRSGGVRGPGLFALACIAVSTVLAWLATGTSDSAVEGVAIPFVFDLVFFAVYLGLTHALVRLLLRGRSAGLSATFRIVAYSQVGQLVNWLPTVGLAIGSSTRPSWPSSPSAGCTMPAGPSPSPSWLYRSSSGVRGRRLLRHHRLTSGAPPSALEPPRERQRVPMPTRPRGESGRRRPVPHARCASPTSCL